MKKMITLAVLLLATVAAELGAAPTGASILQRLDDMENLGVDVSSRVKLTQQKKKTGTKEIGCIFYRRDRDDAFLIVMTAPNAEKGNGYLRVGDNFWMYRSSSRVFQHVNRDESIGGSNAKGGDFEKRKMVELYRPVIENGAEKVAADMLGQVPVWRIELIAKVNDVTYPKQIYWVRQDNGLPLKVQSYALSGTLMETAYYLNFTMIAGKYFLVKGLFIDEFEKGDRTLLEISGISLAPIPGNVFTKPYLENLSR